MDTLKVMRGALGRVHELLMALEKAGFTEEIFVEVINSKGNQLAGEMFNSLPERLRTKWNMADLKLIFKVDKENVHQKFLKTISNNHDEEIFTEGKRTSTKNEVSDEVHSKIFHFNYIISNRDSIEEMRKQGYRPATDYETLTFCELNSDWAKNYKVCALGTEYKSGILGDRYYTRFYYVTRNKVLCLAVENHDNDNDNLPSARFLGIFDPENKAE